MRIEMHRSVDVRGWRFLGDVARAQAREELIGLLMQAQHRAPEPLGPEDICAADGLLPGRPPIIARRLIGIARAQGLVEADRGVVTALTDDGLAALQEDQVFVAEHGPWTVWVVDDPLLPTLPIRIERATFERGAGGKTRGGEEQASLANAPRRLSEVQRKRFSPWCGTRTEARIDAVEKVVEALHAKAQLRLSFILEPRRAPTLEVTGAVDGSKVDLPINPPDTDHAEVFAALMMAHGLLDRWSQGVWHASFDELVDDVERGRHRRRWRPDPVAFEEFGHFEVNPIADIPLAPLDDIEASHWARWHLQRSITSPLWADGYAEAQARARARFEQYDVTLPDRASLAADVRGDDRAPPAYWHLQAPLDLATEEAGR